MLGKRGMVVLHGLNPVETGCVVGYTGCRNAFSHTLREGVSMQFIAGWEHGGAVTVKVRNSYQKKLE